MSGGRHEPRPDAPAGPPRWADYLDWLREDLIAAVLALEPAQRRGMRVPTGWSPLELLSHVLHTERRWFLWGFLGEAVEDPWGDWNLADPRAEGDATRPGARWVVADDVTAEDLVSRLRAVGERTREVLLDHPPSARAAIGGRFAADPPTLEWICFHVLAEYARHAGHLDVATEVLGGRPPGIRPTATA